MDQETANEIANLYDTLRWVCEIQVKLAVGVQSLSAVVSQHPELSEAYALYCQDAENGELPKQLTALLTAIGVRMEALRKGQVPPEIKSIQ